MNKFWGILSFLITYLILAWFMGTWLNLKGSDLWILRGGLALLGFIAAGLVLWFWRSMEGRRPAQEGALEEPAVTEDIDLLVRDAMRELKSSRLGRDAALGTLPVVYLVGESSSTKTTTILNSSLEPELLAGQAHHDNDIIPTAVANIWYARQAVFVDPSGAFVSQPRRWERLIKLMQPGNVASVLKKSQQAPRAAIVCFDAETFLQQGGSSASQAVARKLSSRLREMSRVLSASFPVYVLFTRMDRVPFFTEYARNLTREEASEVLGSTLPVRSLQPTGVYAEEETRRLNTAFDDLFYSLAEKRLDLLVREPEQEKPPGIYEFPREVRKLRGLLVQFLVDLARPSQLRANPFLRGFYFTGVRAIVVDDIMPAVAAPAAAEASDDPGATRIFALPRQQQAPASIPAARSRKVPQWVFLTRLFNDVILQDRVALSASGVSTRVNVLRRVLLGAAILTALVCCTGFTVSFFENRALETELNSAAREISAANISNQRLAALPDLQRLDRLRQAVATLARYNEQGAPWRLHWGLYIGDRLYPQARGLYFNRFHQLLLAQTQANILTWLRRLPDSPRPDDSYEKTYNALKAYLITTSNSDRSSAAFLSPVLSDFWPAGQDPGPGRAGLAIQQFDFYATELAKNNPFPPDNDGAAIGHARGYLSKFAGIEGLYLGLLSSAPAKSPAVSFNEQFENSRGVVNSNYRVRGAFSLNGFKFMQSAMLHPANFGGEEWVLGKAALQQLDPATLQQKLQVRYYADFVNEWRAVLTKSHVAPFGVHDAIDRLDKLGGQSSPLLELLYFVSHHTNVGVASVDDVFGPVRVIEPPGPADKLPDQYLLPSNTDYVQGLRKLQSELSIALASPQGLSDPATATRVIGAAQAAKLSALQVMGGRIDQTFGTENVVRQLLEEPITQVEAMVKGGPKQGLNAAGRTLCQQFDKLAGKYPFNPAASEELSIDTLNSLFAPKTGAIWQFQEHNLAPFVVRQGSRFVSTSSGSVSISPGFLAFFNHAVAVSEALYPQASSSPRLAYSLRQLPSNVEGVALDVGPEKLTGVGQQKTFFWTGASEDIQATAGNDILESAHGPWAIFRFVASAKASSWGSTTDLLWIQQSNGHPIILKNGKEKSFSYQLQVSGPNLFQPGEFSTLHCVPVVAH